MTKGWPATLVVAVVGLALATPVAAQATHKDTKIGFSFKPPKDFTAIAIDPTEHITVAKYQSEQADQSGDGNGGLYNRDFLVKFYPAKQDKTFAQSDGEDEDKPPLTGDPSKDEHAAGPTRPTASAMVESLRDGKFAKFDGKEKTVKLAGTTATELTFTASDSPISYYALVLEQDDGVFVMQGSSLSQRFDKACADFSAAAKSFKRIERADLSAHVADLKSMDEQSRFLQQQIDKLPPGWSYLKTRRYVFLYDADKSFVEELAARIEAMRDQYEKDYPPTKPIDAISIVRVCANEAEYHGYGGPYGSGGYWYDVARELVVYDEQPRETTLAIVNHEAFHQYIYYFYGELAPHPWYNEGTGDVYAGAKLSKSNKIQAFGDPPGGVRRQEFIKEAARLLGEGKRGSEGAAAPPKLLMHFHHLEYYGSAGYDIGVCYAEGWSLNHFLRLGRLEPKWQKILPDYLRALLAARDQVAKDVMDKAIAKAEKKEAGSSAKLPKDIKDWYGKLDEGDVQDIAYDATFKDWTDSDWAAFQAAWLKYVEKL
ncbi:MAG TPA: hypothetical protein VFY71_05995 [Planctomycetota bacterium]|nr:hypothetical protein [Planctomycetota bacterium]